MNSLKKPFFRLLAAALAVFLLSASAFAVCSEHRMDSGAVTLEPTCDLIGVITYACQNDGCDYAYTEKLGNLGHRYEDGICQTCGGYEEGYVPAEPAPETPPVVLKAPAAAAPVSEPVPDVSAKEPAAPVMLASPVVKHPSFADPFTLAVLILTLACGTGAILLNRRLICH